jgi:hypothetical protein
VSRLSSASSRCIEFVQEVLKLRAALDHLSDKELIDIGITRGEIDHVARSRYIDQRRPPNGSDIYLR